MARSDGSLLPSAKEFLSESLRNLGEDRLSLAILHAVTATELILKERLRRLNPALVLENLDARDVRHAKTVSLRAIPHRLANLGNPLDPSDAQLVGDIAEWRHAIVHHMPVYDKDLAGKQLPKLLDFLAAQLRLELATPLEQFLPVGLYRDASRYIGDWRNAVDAARSRAQEAGEVIPREVCPSCGGVEVMSRPEEGRAHCHLCHTDFYVCGRCPGCGRSVMSTYELLPGGVYCDECVDDLGQAYGESLWEMQSGR